MASLSAGAKTSTRDHHQIAAQPDRAPPGAPPWHAAPGDAAPERLTASSLGLTAAEAAARLSRFGRNPLPPPAQHRAWFRLLPQFHDLLLYVLIAAGLVTPALRDRVDAGVIFGEVINNAIVDFVQEGKAERALDAVRAMLASRALVLRDGQRVPIDAAERVPGDIVLPAPRSTR